MNNASTAHAAGAGHDSVALQSVIDLGSETFGRAVEVADGFWLLATRHHPGGSRSMPEVNNRCLIFRLIEDGTPILLVINGVHPSAIPEVQRIEKESGLRVRYVLSAGGGHHVLLPPWVEAFPNASILVGPTRIPRTASGQKLLSLPRVDTFDPERLLPQFKGQLDFVSFRGLFTAPDNPSPGEGGADGIRMILKLMLGALFRMRDPVDELWTFHVATRTLIAGENLGWIYPAAAHARLPAMLRRAITPDAVYVFKDARKVADAEAVDRFWREILQWPAKTVLTFHDPPGHGFQGDGPAALEAAARRAGQLRE
jgi:hypothetical protein